MESFYWKCVLKEMGALAAGSRSEFDPAIIDDAALKHE
jgi:hypothetical protein